MAPAEPREIELKLSVRREDLSALERHPLLQVVGAPEGRDELTTYFDTARLGLAKKGFSLRVRRTGNKRIQTLKSARDGRTLAASRGEWEWPVHEDAPDLARLADVPLAKTVLDEAAAGLEPVFRTKIRRTIRSIDLPGGAVVEAAFDVGEVSSGTARQDVCELELELKQGSPGSLYRLALDLHGSAPFIIGVESKAERGRQLRTGKTPSAVESKPPKLLPDETASAAIRRIITVELGHVLANQPAIVAGDIEGVHQLRVGIRRLRTVLALFGKRLDREITGRWDAELKRLGQVFGRARDWDVFCNEILPAAAKGKHSSVSATALQGPAEGERKLAHEAVRQELGRPALTGLVLAMAAWAEPDGLDSTGHEDSRLRRPITKLAPGLLDHLARKVEKRGGRFKHRSAEELHGLRKALKRLRYSMEFVSALYPAKQTRDYEKPTRRLLKLLGTANDAQVASPLAAGFGKSDQSELGTAIAGLHAWSMHRAVLARRKLPKAWDEFVARSPVWR